MKTLSKNLAAVAMIALTTFSIATATPSVKRMANLSTAQLTIENYVDVITAGQSEFVDQILAKDFNQKVANKDAIVKNERAQVVDFLKKQKGEKLNCKTTTKILEQTNTYVIAKVTMEFEGFTKVDNITLVKENNTWKVSSSMNSYQ